jgi:hypothetical protein
MARSRRRGGVRAALCALAAAALLPGDAGGAAALQAGSGALPPQSAAVATAAAAAAAAGVLCEYACAGGACLRLLGCAPRAPGAAPDEGGCTVRGPHSRLGFRAARAAACPRLPPLPRRPPSSRATS